MSYPSLIQLLSASIGIVGSLFFAIGVVRQSTEAMARLSGSYYDSNPHMPRALSAQKADYVFGGGLILIAFSLQFLSFLAPNSMAVEQPHVRSVLLAALAATVIVFFALRLASTKLALHFEQKVNDFIQREEEEHQRQRAIQKAAKNAPT